MHTSPLTNISEGKADKWIWIFIGVAVKRRSNKNALLSESKGKVWNINLYLQLIIKITVANRIATNRNKFYNLFGTELTFCIALYSTRISAYFCLTSKRGRMIHKSSVKKTFMI